MRAIYVDKDIPRVLLTKALTPHWHDFVWTPLSAARFADLGEPSLPGSRWVRLQNEQCGICASDLSLLFVHADPSCAPAALPYNQRFYLGHETVSRVIETGPGVTRLKPGDRVIMDTHFDGPNCATLEIDPPCRYCAKEEYHYCVNKSKPGARGIGGGFGDGYVTHESAVYPCPDGLTPEQQVLTEPLAVAVHTVMNYPPLPGDKVLVIGAGIIGLLTTLVAHALAPEAEITTIARHPHQAQMAERLGARHILSGRVGYDAVARLTGGKYFTAPLNKGTVVGGFDLIYDCVADDRTTNDSLRWTRAGGTVVMVGAHIAPMPRVDLTPIWYDNIRLVGVYAHATDVWNGVRKHTYEWVFDLFREGRLPTDGLITHRFPLKDYKQAIRAATAKGREKAIKVVFEMEG